VLGLTEAMKRLPAAPEQKALPAPNPEPVLALKA
jgi:hypothetical protein